MTLDHLHISTTTLVRLTREFCGETEAQNLARWIGSSSHDVVRLCWDTREIKQPGGNHSASPPTLFFARRGRNFDPSGILNTLLDQGLLVVADQETAGNSGHLLRSENETRLLIASERSATERFLRAAAGAALAPEVQGLRTIAITGTNGKTSTTSLTAQIVREISGHPSAELGTLGFFDGHTLHPQSFPTTPDFPAFCQYLNQVAKSGTRHLVMEASSHGLEEERLGHWTFDAAAITNLTPDHLDFHGTMESYWAAKQLLFRRHLRRGSPAVVAAAKVPWRDLEHHLREHEHLLYLVWDENQCGRCPHHVLKAEGIRVITYSASTKQQQRSPSLALDIGRDNDAIGSTFQVHSDQLSGAFQAENLAVALTLCHATFGFSWELLSQSLKSLRPVTGRMQCINPGTDAMPAPLVFVDYAHSPDALESVLKSLRQQADERGGKIVTVFGCGGDRDKTKRPIMGRIAKELSDRVIVTSDNPRTENPQAILSDITAGLTKDGSWMVLADRAHAIEQAIVGSEPQDIVLIAGKGHEEYQIIGHKKVPFSDASTARNVLEKILPSSTIPRGSK